MGTWSDFSADDLFLIRDNRVPLGIVEPLKGLIKPFESIFPKSRVPNSERVVSEFIKARGMRTPQQPLLLEMKKDWVEWILWELRLRLVMAERFHMFCDGIRRGWSIPIILFLREFREISYSSDVGAFVAVQSERDHMLRDRIELMFPECPVLWLANPRDDLNRSFFNSTYQQKANDNSIPYIASEDWLGCVRLLADAADIIVMSNTKSSGGVGQEVALLKEDGFLDKTFFSAHDQVSVKADRINSIDDLTPGSLQHAKSGQHSKVLELAPLRHWVGPESLEYTGQYIEAVDWCAGECKGLGEKVTYDVFAAVFMALIALLIVRGELKGAAKMQQTLARIIQRWVKNFGPYDVLAVNALLESAEWYGDNADRYCVAHALRFINKPRTGS
jgi:hypothetical protein